MSNSKPNRCIARSITLLISILLAAGLTTSRAQNTWTQKADLGYDAVNVPEPTPRDGAVGFSIGSKGYLGTGGVAGENTKDFWEYDPDADTWTQKADFGGNARWGAVGFSIGSKGYLGTGYDGSSLHKDFWEYDPDADTWTQKADFGGTARYYAVGFGIGSKGYLGTGWGGSYKKDFWEYDPDADTWTQKTDFGGTPRYWAVGFSIGSKGYLGTGANATLYYKDFWEYDPDANTWTQKADFGGTARNGAVGFSSGSKGYLGTGYDGFNKKDCWEYDPDANTWTQKADFGGAARYWAVGFSIGSKGYLGTGWDGGYTKDFWEYDPDANTWTQKADFGGTARQSAVGFSIGSKGYLGTGTGGTVPYATKDFWEYDPDANTWTQKADFGGAARSAAVGFSIGSKGYLGAGYNYDSTFHYCKDFWEYTPDIIPNLASSDSSVCEKFCINFYDSTFNDATAWQWIFEGGDPSSSTEQNPTNICYDLPGVYDVTLITTSANGIDTFYKPNYITVNATPPIPLITQVGYTLTSSAADFYQWQFNAADIPGATNQSYDAMQTGYYTVITNDVNGCASSTTLYVEITGIENLFSDQNISVSPNPTNGTFIAYLKLNYEKNEDVTVDVLNMFGQKVYSQQVQLLKGVMQKEIQLSDVAADGVYVVKVIINDQVYSSQISYQK